MERKKSDGAEAASPQREARTCGLALSAGPLVLASRCGLAAFASHFFRTLLRLHAVAAEGDRVDYWVLHETQEYALEISGTMGADIESRHRQKSRQLRDNPYGIDGYVVVVGFATRRMILSFERFEEPSHEPINPARN